MSKDANNSGAAGKETRNALLVGLLLILLLILAPLYWVERAQQDLTERSRVVLRSQGLDPSAFEIDFDGRDARLAGDQAQAAELDQARRLVHQVWGVRTVSTRASSSGSARTPDGSALTSTSEPAEPAFGGEPTLRAPADSTPPAPSVASPVVQAMASAEPIPGQPPEPAVPPAPLAPKPHQASEATEPPAPQPTAPASAPPAPKSTAPETAPSPAPAGQATDLPRSQPPKPTAAALADPEAQPGPVTGVPAVTGHRAAPEAETPALEQEPTGQPAEASPGAATATAEAPSTPAAPAQIDSTPAPELKAPAADAVTPEAPPASSPAPKATAATVDKDTPKATGDISTDTLLIDWPDLAAVEDLRLELQQDQVWLRGRVNSLADLQRIENQFPDSAAGRHVRLDVRLAERGSQELADYLNLVAASFRFRAGTSHFGPAGERAMDRIADTLKSYPRMRLGLAGRAPETRKPQVRRVHARHRAGATYRALLKRGVDGRQLFLADFASPFPPLLGHAPVATRDPSQIQFFSLER